MKIEDINKVLREFSYDELVCLKNNIIDEIRIKGGDQKAVSCFWNILDRAFKRRMETNEKRELLEYLVTHYTEKEFSDFMGVGEQVMRIAKHELKNNGLAFKT